MKRSLLLLALVVGCMSVGRAGAQFIFVDLGGDSLCGNDLFTSTGSSIDVYLDTDRNASGSTVTCPSGEPLSLSSYEVIFRWSGGDRVGDYVEYGTWTNAVSQFTVDLGEARGGRDLRVGFASNSIAFLPAGRYKLGSLALTMSGCTYLSFAPSSGLSPSYVTGFYSQCPGVDAEHLLKFGTDFTDNCGLSNFICDAVHGTSTTWGKIKMLYR